MIRYVPNRQRDRAEVQRHLYPTPALERVGWSAPRLSRINPTKLGASRGWVKISRHSQGFETGLSSRQEVVMPIEPTRPIERKDFSENVSKIRVPVALQVSICLASLHCSLLTNSSGFNLILYGPCIIL